MTSEHCVVLCGLFWGLWKNTDGKRRKRKKAESKKRSGMGK